MPLLSDEFVKLGVEFFAAEDEALCRTGASRIYYGILQRVLEWIEETDPSFVRPDQGTFLAVEDYLNAHEQRHAASLLRQMKNTREHADYNTHEPFSNGRHEQVRFVVQQLAAEIDGFFCPADRTPLAALLSELK